MALAVVVLIVSFLAGAADLIWNWAPAWAFALIFFLFLGTAFAVSWHRGPLLARARRS